METSPNLTSSKALNAKRVTTGLKGTSTIDSFEPAFLSCTHDGRNHKRRLRQRKQMPPVCHTAEGRQKKGTPRILLESKFGSNHRTNSRPFFGRLCQGRKTSPAARIRDPKFPQQCAFSELANALARKKKLQERLFQLTFAQHVRDMSEDFDRENGRIGAFGAGFRGDGRVFGRHGWK